MLRKSLISFLIVLLASPSSMAQDSLKTISNPVFSGYKSHDMSLIKGDDGRYYAFGTCNVSRDENEKLSYYAVNIFQSNDLINWTFLKKAFPDSYVDQLSYDPKFDSKREKGYYFIWQSDSLAAYPVWAPDIIKYKDKYILFISLRNSYSDSKIAVLESDSITQDFSSRNIVVSTSPDDGKAYVKSKEIIDPFPIIDDNQLYLVYGSFARNGKGIFTQKRSGIATYIVPLEEGPNGYYMKEAPTFISDYYEGNCILKRNGKYFLFGTNGALTNNTYKVSYATSHSVLGPYINNEGKSIADTININLGKVILETQDPNLRFNGFGCMSTPITDKEGRNFVLMNGHDLNLPPIIDKTSARERYSFLLELHWDQDGNPYFDLDEIENNNIIKPNI